MINTDEHLVYRASLSMKKERSTSETNHLYQISHAQRIPSEHKVSLIWHKKKNELNLEPTSIQEEPKIETY